MCFSLQSIDINTGELTPSRRDRCSGLRPRLRYVQWTRSHVQDWNFYLAVWLSPIKWPENEIVFFGDHEDVGSANASNSKLAVMSKARRIQRYQVYWPGWKTQRHAKRCAGVQPIGDAAVTYVTSTRPGETSIVLQSTLEPVCSAASRDLLNGSRQWVKYRAW